MFPPFAYLCPLLSPAQDAGGARSLASSSSFGAAMASFSSRVGKGESASESSSAGALWTKHQGAITCVQAVARAPSGAVTAFSTSGLDGRVVVWNVAALAHVPGVVAA